MGKIVLVFSLNPSVDVEWLVPSVVWEEKNNILSERRWAGGKGVNVARWLNFLAQSQSRGGVELETKLCLPLGGATGREMEQYLSAEKLSCQVISVAQSTRANIIVTTDARRQLRFNPLGPELSDLEWRRIFDYAEEASDVCAVVFSGSLPKNAPKDTYQKLIGVFNKRNIPTILDCDGAAFSTGVDGHPFLVKPNRVELEQWAGRPLPTREEMWAAVKELSDKTQGNVLLSLGGDGAMLYWRGKALVLFAKGRSVSVQNTVGAGDALLAGAVHALAKENSAQDILRMAVAAGTMAVSHHAGVMPTYAELSNCVRDVVVQSLSL